MTIYDTARQTAQAQIETFGSELTLRKVVQGSYNTSTGTVSETTTSYSFSAIIESPGGRGDEIDRNFALSPGDLLLLLAEGALDVEIEPRDIVVIDSQDWRVIAIDPPYSGDQVVVRTVQVRRE